MINRLEKLVFPKPIKIYVRIWLIEIYSHMLEMHRIGYLNRPFESPKQFCWAWDVPYLTILNQKQLYDQ